MHNTLGDMIEPAFSPISDKSRFPLLAMLGEFPCAHLVGCMDLTFYAPKKLADTYPVIAQEGVDWHLYGDTRWPSPAAWIEFDTGFIGYTGGTGILVLNVEIPEDESDTIAWVANNAPLEQIFPEERSEQARGQRLKMLKQQVNSIDTASDIDESEPRYAQSYCIYREQVEVRLVACYTDLLNANGIPISKYRTANVHPNDIDFCRFSLHALFKLRNAYKEGMDFIEVPQLEIMEPIFLERGQVPPRWIQFHPSRQLKTRPAVRAVPSPEKMIDGIMFKEDFERVVEARRLEESLELLAYSIPARHNRERVPFQDDVDACLGAYTHRANGGAIYLLPDRLVEEFNKTDCDEIRLSDLKLPFNNVFIKFVPPEPLYLAEGAPVDGCYIVKQPDEYFISLTSHWEGVDYVRSLPITCIDPRFNLHLPTINADITITQAVQDGFKAFIQENAPPAENFSRTITRPDGTTCYIEDVRAKSRLRRISTFQDQEPVFRACLNIIFNAACFISFRPEDISDEWDGDMPAWIIEALDDTRDTRSARDRKRHAQQVVAQKDYTRIKICGKKLFAEVSHGGNTGHGISPHAHWRRGHWRRQRYGPALALVAPRWIRPTIVKKDNGTPVESRIYDVAANSDQSPTPPDGKNVE